MKRIACVLAACIFTTTLFGQDLSLPNNMEKQIAMETLNTQPLHFTENRGQIHSDVKFSSRGGGISTYLTEKGITFLLSKETEASRQRRLVKRSQRTIRREEDHPQVEKDYHALHLQLEGCNFNTEIVGEDRLSWNNNYFIGNDPSKWRTDVPNYQSVRFKEIYEGIDLIVTGEHGKIQHRFEVQPGANPNQIVQSYQGADNVVILENGYVEIETPLGKIIQKNPRVYQVVDGVENVVEASLPSIRMRSLQKKGPGFEIDSRTYDSGKTLFVEPEIDFMVTWGGYEFEFGEDITLDNKGNIYTVGYTNSESYPVTETAYDTSYNDIFDYDWLTGYDVFVTKLKSDGSALVYSTFLGGELNDEGYAIDLDQLGCVYVTGRTGPSYSDPSDAPVDFPVTPGAYLEEISGKAIFSTKLNANGNNLIYSTLIGSGTGTDLKTDDNCNAYVAGRASEISTTENAVSRDAEGGFVCKLNYDGTDLIYSACINKCFIDAIELDKQSNLYATGRVLTDGSFTTTPGAYIEMPGNNLDINIFVFKLNQDGSNFIYSTLMNAYPSHFAVYNEVPLALDDNENAYILGEVDDFPVTNQASHNTDIFIAQLNNQGSALVYASYLNFNMTNLPGDEEWGAWDIDINDIAIDQNRYLYLAGYQIITSEIWTQDDIPLLYVFNMKEDDIIYYYPKLHDDFFAGQAKAVFINNYSNVYFFGNEHNIYNNDCFVYRIIGIDQTSEIDSRIEIRYPNSTDVDWEIGSTVAIQWKAFGNVGDLVKIEILKDEELAQIITPDTPNDGHKTWTVSSRLTPGPGYQIKISSISNPSVHQLSHAFTISGAAEELGETYLAPGIADFNVPVLDGKLDDSVWNFVDPDSLLKGGKLNAYDSTIVAFDDYLVTFKAVWCDDTNRLYVGVDVQDDIRGTLDNGPSSNYYLPYEDESLEFFTDGDYSGGDYWGLYGPAQAWCVSQENAKGLYNYPDPSYNYSVYTGNGMRTAVSLGENGNWSCEAVFIIYNDMTADIRDLSVNDIIGWEVRYCDSDDESSNAIYYTLDHQVGWNYQGKAWRNADVLGALTLGDLMEIPALEVTYPEKSVKFERNKLQEIQWRSLGNVGSLLQIDLYKGNTLNKTLSDTTLNDSLYNWMISADQEMGSDYRVRIQSHINSDVYAYSDTFDIIEYRRITITHPDTLNIQYKSGDDLPIQWTHSGAIGDEVMIELYKNGQFNFLITDNTENDGEYIWPIPIEQDTSSAYRIKVTALSDDTILDWSNNPFSILKDTGVENNPIPRTNQLYGNYPNPFNPETTVRYQIAQSTNVQVTIYNILGEKVKTLINAVQNEGQHEIQWKGRNDQGQGVASGVFIVELKAGEFTQRQKVMLIR